MIRHLLLILFVYGLLTIQVGCSRELSSSLLPVWLPGLALMLCLEFSTGAMLLAWTACVGLLTDCLSVDPLGTNAIIATVIGIMVTLIRAEGRVSTITSVVVTTLLTTFVWRFASMTVLSLVETQSINLEKFAQIAIKNSLSNAAVAWALMLLMTFWRLMGARDAGPSLSLRNRWTMLTNQ